MVNRINITLYKTLNRTINILKKYLNKRIYNKTPTLIISRNGKSKTVSKMDSVSKATGGILMHGIIPLPQANLI